MSESIDWTMNQRLLLHAHQNAQCSDNNPLTFDRCNNPATASSTCEHIPIRCAQDVHCDNGNPFTQDVCINGGSLGATCIHTPIMCLSDANCPAPRQIGNSFCGTEDVFVQIQSYTCENPGTTAAFCQSHIQTKQDQICAHGCQNGACMQRRVSQAEKNLYISNLRLGSVDGFTLDEEIRLSFTLENNGDIDFDDLKVSAVIYDLGLYYSFGSFDLDSGDRITTSKAYAIPFNPAPGRYDVRITMSNDHIRRVVHREVIVQ